jgi:hypothetical protein
MVNLPAIMMAEDFFTIDPNQASRLKSHPIFTYADWRQARELSEPHRTLSANIRHSYGPSMTVIAAQSRKRLELWVKYQDRLVARGNEAGGGVVTRKPARSAFDLDQR